MTVAEGVKEVISKLTVKNTDLPENWALLLNSTTQVTYKVKTAKLGSLFNTAAAATVAEAYELKEIISDNESAKSGKIINTGTIDPYTTSWGVNSMNYIKDRYKYPYVDMNQLKEKEWHKLNKIIVAGMALRIEATYSHSDEYLPAKSTAVIYCKDSSDTALKSLLALLNSRYVSYLFKQENSQLSMAGGYMNVNAGNIADIQIPLQLMTNELLADSADSMLELSTELQNKDNAFKQIVASEFEIEKWSTKLNKWWTLDFTDFIKLLKVKLSLAQKDELLQLFDKYKTELQSLDNRIQTTSHEIDKVVYELYDLSLEEIAIVEGR